MDREVYDRVMAHARGKESPNQALRRLFGLPPSRRGPKTHKTRLDRLRAQLERLEGTLATVKASIAKLTDEDGEE
jgi:hypothetical protein